MLSRDDYFRVLRNVSESMKTGGLFVQDVRYRDTALKGLFPSIATENGKDLMIDRMTFDSLRGRMYNKRIVIRDGVRKEKPFYLRYYNPSEMQTLLKEVDLTIREIYGGYDETHISSNSRCMIIGSEK